MRKQKGFSIIEIVIIIAIIAVIGFIGWWVYTRNTSTSTTESTTSTVESEDQISKDVPVPTNKQDLQNLDNQLNSASLGDTNVSDLASELNF